MAILCCVAQKAASAAQYLYVGVLSLNYIFKYVLRNINITRCTAYCTVNMCVPLLLLKYRIGY
jgi:hypothetical protein